MVVDLLMCPEPKANSVSAGGGLDASTGSNTLDDDVEVFTYVKLDKKNGRWVWRQECVDKVLPNSEDAAP